MNLTDDLLSILGPTSGETPQRLRVSDLRHGEFFKYRSGPITIFGEVFERTEFEEDTAVIEGTRTRGFIYSRCFSVACPDGEFGDVHVTSITAKISREEFEAAMGNGWVAPRAIGV